ncbi:hypothetical protein I8751_13735 [Nostocaceae cyanobacterium CENA357]|uniref:Uncharacterized protein n=1 Tax=Atlanticothrix silvestris CENA357 TaxID=1725252 RepID=A0A8J7L5T4_9CYAN|nr:hypothetical protein [Atlanticothrix silvestris]MBH8553417.1 hypothetical protein [Atlanticothrix silvestris CENA357]
MNNGIKCLQSEDIEISCGSNFNKKNNRSFGESLHYIWKKIVKTLLVDSQELQVLQRNDRYGNIYWQAYDPVTGKSFSSGSKADISMWIEQLYRY